MKERMLYKCLRLLLCGVIAVCLLAFVMKLGFSVNAASYNSSSLQSGGVLTLTEDSTLSMGQFQVNSGRTYTIDLNGHTLTLGANDYFMMIGGTVNLIDSSADQTGVLKLTGSRSYGLAWFYQGGTFNFYSGTIDGSGCTGYPQYGGAFHLAGSNQQNVACIVNMYGGTIQNCQARDAGGAVYVGADSKSTNDYSQFNMYGGKITGCTSKQGGAIYINSSGSKLGVCSLDGSTRTMTDCLGNTKPYGGLIVISGNTATSTNSAQGHTATLGDAVYNYGKFNIQGYLDINGTVYLNNEWEGHGTSSYIQVTGPLCVVGNGYINVNTEYTYEKDYEENLDGYSGYTVVENSSGGTIPPEIFYTYAEYFYNDAWNRGVTEGYYNGTVETPGGDSVTQNISWSSWNMGNHYLDYYDVMGIKWRFVQSSSAGIGYQNHNYLIYAKNKDGNEQTYHSVKLYKEDGNTHSRLSGASFVLEKSEDGGSTWTTMATQSSGIANTGESGMTYFFEGSDVLSHKLMLMDGMYRIREVALSQELENAGYQMIPGALSIIITVNGTTVSITGDSTYFTVTETGETNTSHEIIFTAKNYSTPPPPSGFTLKGIKYGYLYQYGCELEGAVLSIAKASDPSVSLDTAVTANDGSFTFTVTLDYGVSYVLTETSAPAGYVLIDPIYITVPDASGSGATVTNGMSAETNLKYALFDSSEQELTVKLLDEILSALPSTGGEGVYIVIISGMFIMCGFAAAFVINGRKRRACSK